MSTFAFIQRKSRRQIERDDVNGTDIDRIESEGHQEGILYNSFGQNETEQLTNCLCFRERSRSRERSRRRSKSRSRERDRKSRDKKKSHKKDKDESD